MREGDDPNDINPDATPENTFLPVDAIPYYRPNTLQLKGK